MNLDGLLLQVQKPGRYTGGEWNSVKKEWTPDRVKVLLSFADTYEVGMSHLGLKILYGILNERDDCLCERVFSPWSDFENILRQNKISLFSLESKRPIGEFDIIGFSLTYELGYTNVLNLLDLGNIPLKSSERTDRDPLIIAGGPACYNPEPMAEFIDAFIIGEAEEAILEVIDVYRRTKPACRQGRDEGRETRDERRGTRDEGRGTPLECSSLSHSRDETRTRVSRAELLKELAKVKGVYVPSLYMVEYNEDGTLKSFFPKEEGVPTKIEKRIVRDLNNSFYPTKQIVPYIQIVHDRIALEIMRGCKHACRFCQATTTYRPCRERSKEKILELARSSYAATGYEEIGLLSLSSGDHSCIMEIIEDLNNLFKDRAVSLSVPSLRIEDILRELPLPISQVKKPGLTLAPEAGSERLRKIINKNIDIDKLFEGTSESYRAGWRRVKLYFMIGLPTEQEDDIAAIAELIKKVSHARNDIDKRPAHVTASINAFVPKPHTPFQWEAMEDIKRLSQKQQLLKSRIKSKVIELDFHSLNMGYLEAVFSRGDRRLAGVIYDAWMSGARFDGWRDLFKFDLWLNAFQKNNLAADFYATRKRFFSELLPWDFIDIGISKEWLIKEAQSRPLI